ncbi:MAG: ATP-binding protein [Campylobacter sp.]|nr:ATP-binding protein [Campylobacter sp.]
MQDSLIDWKTTKAAVFRRNREILKGVKDKDLDIVDIDSLIGLKEQKLALLSNTRKFIEGKGANHALLWGARGCGKSSLAKAVFSEFFASGLRVIEIKKEDFCFLDDILDDIREDEYKFILFCDDLSFENGDNSYKFLKPLLEGSIEKAPSNALMYATSNRRHLMPEYSSDNLGFVVGESELHSSDNAEEKLSLADRFGLRLSFYSGTWGEYLSIVDSYFGEVRDPDKLHTLAKQFSMMSASRSGRTAKQFYNAYKDEFSAN